MTAKLQKAPVEIAGENSDKAVKKVETQNWPYVDPATVGPKNKVRFAGLGYYLPPTVVSTAEIEERMATKPLFSLAELTGIENRRYSDGSESSYDMALKAVQNCLVNAGKDAGEVDAIIFSSISRVKEGYKLQFEPSLALHLKRDLGATGALAFDISNACAGMATGVSVVEQMIRAGQIRNGIVVSGEFISPIAETAMREVVRPIDRQMASLTVGDSAAAVLLEESPTASEGIEFVKLATVGDHAGLCLGKPSATGPGMAMYTQSSKLQSEALKRIPRLQRDIMEENGMFSACYDHIIPHQTSTRAIAKGLKVIEKEYGDEFVAGFRYFEENAESVLKIVKNSGNTSSTSHFIALCDAISSGQVKPGDRIGLMILASGITLGYISITLGDLTINENFNMDGEA